MAQLSHLFPAELSAMCLFLSYKDSFYVPHFISFGESQSFKPPNGGNIYFIWSITFFVIENHVLILFL